MSNYSFTEPTNINQQMQVSLVADSSNSVRNGIISPTIN